MESVLDAERRVVAFCERHAVGVTYLAFAFVFFYFGLQKPAPVTTPVREAVHAFVSALGIPIALASPFIGYYEMTLGLLFLFRRLRLALVLFFAHQLTTLLVLVVVPYEVFQPPWIHVLGVQIPWALDWMSAYVLKNLVFVGGFMLLVRAELGSDGAADDEAGDSSPS